MSGRAGGRSDRRTLRVLLDPSQYHIDAKRHLDEGAEDIYSSFNLVVRRKAKENNFKAVRPWRRARHAAYARHDPRLTGRAARPAPSALAAATWAASGAGNHSRPDAVQCCRAGMAARHFPGLRRPRCAHRGRPVRGRATWHRWLLIGRPRGPRQLLSRRTGARGQGPRIIRGCRSRSPRSTFWTRSSPRST